MSCFREGWAALTKSFGIFKYMACYSLTQFVLFQRGSCSFDNIIWNILVHGLLQSNSNCFREGRAALTTSFGIFKYMACYSQTQFVLFQRGSGSFDNIIWNIHIHGLLQSNSVCLVSERVGQL